MNPQHAQYLIDRIGLMAIGIFSIAYALWTSTFAEFHIEVSFLDFPIFMGEILLFICLILLFIRSRIAPIAWNNSRLVVLLFFSFIVWKAFKGYAAWGAMAFRDAAMFYYLFFMVFGYFFFQKSFFIKERASLLIILVGLIIFGRCTDIYWLLSTILFSFVLISSYQSFVIRCGLFLVLILLIPFWQLFLSSRMMVLANIVAISFLLVSVYIMRPVKRSWHAVVFLAVLLGVFVGAMQFNKNSAISTAVNFKELRRAYVEFENEIIAAQKNYVEKDIEPRLFRPNMPMNYEEESREVQKAVHAIVISEDIAKKSKRIKSKQKPSDVIVEHEKIIANEAIVNPVPPTIVEPVPDGRNTDRAVGNAVFRLLIWRDMGRELIREKPVIGFDFGKPLRSRSLEVLRWAESEWKYNGWIAAHNSYWHMIYRAGIVGALLILGVIFLLIKMIREFWRQKCIVGILLCGVIINWFVAANFLLIFELPYTAIPIWTIYGMTFAYYQQVKKQGSSKKSHVFA